MKSRGIARWSWAVLAVATSFAVSPVRAQGDFDLGGSRSSSGDTAARSSSAGGDSPYQGIFNGDSSTSASAGADAGTRSEPLPGQTAAGSDGMASAESGLGGDAGVSAEAGTEVRSDADEPAPPAKKKRRKKSSWWPFGGNDDKKADKRKKKKKDSNPSDVPVEDGGDGSANPTGSSSLDPAASAGAGDGFSSPSTPVEPTPEEAAGETPKTAGNAPKASERAIQELEGTYPELADRARRGDSRLKELLEKARALKARQQEREREADDSSRVDEGRARELEAQAAAARELEARAAGEEISTAGSASEPPPADEFKVPKTEKSRKSLWRKLRTQRDKLKNEGGSETELAMIQSKMDRIKSVALAERDGGKKGSDETSSTDRPSKKPKKSKKSKARTAPLEDGSAPAAADLGADPAAIEPGRSGKSERPSRSDGSSDEPKKPKKRKKVEFDDLSAPALSSDLSPEATVEPSPKPKKKKKPAADVGAGVDTGAAVPKPAADPAPAGDLAPPALPPAGEGGF